MEKSFPVVEYALMQLWHLMRVPVAEVRWYCPGGFRSSWFALNGVTLILSDKVH